MRHKLAIVLLVTLTQLSWGQEKNTSKTQNNIAPEIEANINKHIKDFEKEFDHQIRALRDSLESSGLNPLQLNFQIKEQLLTLLTESKKLAVNYSLGGMEDWASFSISYAEKGAYQKLQDEYYTKLMKLYKPTVRKIHQNEKKTREEFENKNASLLRFIEHGTLHYGHAEGLQYAHNDFLLAREKAENAFLDYSDALMHYLKDSIILSTTKINKSSSEEMCYYDRLLNKYYNMFIRVIRQRLEINSSTDTTPEELLRQSQRAWLEWRDTQEKYLISFYPDEAPKNYLNIIKTRIEEIFTIYCDYKYSNFDWDKMYYKNDAERKEKRNEENEKFKEELYKY